MEITKEALITFYNRIEQYCIAKWKTTPDDISISGDGTINVTYNNYCCGHNDYESYEIELSHLTADLDIIVKERKEQERLASIENKRVRDKNAEIRKVREKALRKAKYRELKREFE